MSYAVEDINLAFEKVTISSRSSNVEIDLIPGEIYLWGDRQVQHLGYRSWHHYRYAWVKLIDDSSFCVVFPRRLQSIR